MTRTFLALIFLLLTAVACPAGQHPLTETRTADDFYAAFDRDILIKTKFCSVRAFQEKALLRSDLFGELVFMALFAPMPESVFGNFSFYSYKKACGQKRTVRGSKNSRRLSNDTPAI